MVSTSETCKTPGVDNLCFSTVPRVTRTKTDALKLLNDLTKKLKYDTNLSQGAINQAIQRKGIDNLNTRKKYRRYLKSLKGKQYIKLCKEQYRVILKDPLKYISRLRSFAIKHNIKLKFKQIKFLKLLKITLLIQFFEYGYLRLIINSGL